MEGQSQGLDANILGCKQQTIKHHYNKGKDLNLELGESLICLKKSD